MTKSSPCLGQRPARRADRSDARMPERSNLRFPSAFASLLFFFRSPDFFLRGRAVEHVVFEQIEQNSRSAAWAVGLEPSARLGAAERSAGFFGSRATANWWA